MLYIAIRAHYILSGTWDDKMESARIVDSSEGNGGSECKPKMVYQTLPPKLLWKKYPLPYVDFLSAPTHIVKNIPLLLNLQKL